MTQAAVTRFERAVDRLATGMLLWLGVGAGVAMALMGA